MGFFQTSGILNRRGFFGGVVKPQKNPTDVAGLIVWLDATTGLFDATSGGNAVTTDGSAVARWEDQSGNGNHFTQNTINNRPLLKTSVQNSRNIIRCDGVNDNMNKGGILTSQPYTIFITFKFSSGGRTLSGNNNNWLLGSWGGYSNRAFNGAWVFEGTSTSTAFQTATLKCNSLGAKYYQNGTELGSNNNTGAPNGLIFGKGLSGASPDGEHASCDICEIIGYDSDISLENLSGITNYLANKWGI